ncbi:unnamed protein product [Rotaria sp. Silwood1]|nr:unnamed protein product [Rotaria sp. Silwood1]
MVTIASQTKNISFLDQVTRAETLWAINAARHGYSYLSCDESGDLFKTMFPDSDIAQKFKMERTKLSYMISHGLDPFSIYWSVQNQGVVTRYYKCILLGHAPTNIIRDSIVDSFRTDRIDIKRLLMIGRDNPNVNKTVEKLIDGELKKAGGELLKLGSCHIHMVHNAFKAGQKLELLNEYFLVYLPANDKAQIKEKGWATLSSVTQMIIPSEKMTLSTKMIGS